MFHQAVFLAKIDLSAAYRSVNIHPSNYAVTWLKWTFAGDTEPTYDCAHEKRALMALTLSGEITS